ncbi:hypothetical conserved protein [Oceanobacillus iheyensis HTE831]|uniref:Hypothetical conserved protein n=1 Tax=Oceanobacillus iheyensis (strain DSM 14371 / CIP 107618 / JCM 11309 / KCTC 3954 / HTE831) TaxID=221109 RepID=Q8ETG0_OCEIH|nr:NUDIX hydrolase [Oceanobacillus iheyensis]BAC12257.1 hypothetical conserved protein [Oceanobacillus iheyensis HTE831]
MPNVNGISFVNILMIDESDLVEIPELSGSFAIIECRSKYLLCFNTLRKQWELPAGKREKNESPKECAIRELYEETSQSIMDMAFIGILISKDKLGKVKYNPLFYARVEELQTFIPNKETSGLKLWGQADEISPIDPIDENLLQCISSHIKKTM